MRLPFNFFPVTLLQQYMTLNTGGGQLTSFWQDTCCDQMMQPYTSLLQGHK